MAPWWHNLIKLWEMPDATALDTQIEPRRPGIHYAVKQALDKRNLLEDIGAVLERGMRGDRPPAGLMIGQLRPGSVGLTFNRYEIDSLYQNGINPIIVRHGVPYVWGQKFFTDGQVYRIADLIDGLTPEFRKFIAKPLLQNGFCDPLNESAPEQSNSVVVEPVALTAQQAAMHRAINARSKAFGLVTLEAREVA